MYLLSGFLFPFIILIISNTNFLNYDFKKREFNLKTIKNLSLLVISNLIILALLLSNYIIVFIDLFVNLINNFNFNFNIEIYSNKYIFPFIVVLLLISKSKIFVKKLILFIFLFISIVTWLNTNNILTLDYDIFYKHIIFTKFFEVKNINILNILNLFLIEVTFYFWSYISYKNNLSDWKVLFPTKEDFYPLFNIFIFYACTIFYYSR